VLRPTQSDFVSRNYQRRFRMFMLKCVRLTVSLLLLLTVEHSTLAQESGNLSSASNSLVQLLRAKGILSPEEAASVLDSSSADQRLAMLILDKGLISPQEYETTVSSRGPRNPVSPSAPVLVPAVMRTTSVIANTLGDVPQLAAKPAEKKFVPAITPLRVLPIGAPKKDGLLPDIKLGSGAVLRPYGFFKASVVNQTASSGGPTFGSNDFVQGPLLLGDTGPTADGQFHVKDRALRLGVDFEWPDLSPNLTLTGKLEFDFEGDFTNVNNRNISANRSSQP
jgi:hypothetical protein